MAGTLLNVRLEGAARAAECLAAMSKALDGLEAAGLGLVHGGNGHIAFDGGPAILVENERSTGPCDGEIGVTMKVRPGPALGVLVERVLNLAAASGDRTAQVEWDFDGWPMVSVSKFAACATDRECDHVR